MHTTLSTIMFLHRLRPGATAVVDVSFCTFCSTVPERWKVAFGGRTSKYLHVKLVDTHSTGAIERGQAPRPPLPNPPALLSLTPPHSTFIWDTTATPSHTSTGWWRVTGRRSTGASATTRCPTGTLPLAITRFDMYTKSLLY